MQNSRPRSVHVSDCVDSDKQNINVVPRSTGNTNSGTENVL